MHSAKKANRALSPLAASLAPLQPVAVTRPTPHFTVLYDQKLNAAGEQVATSVQAASESLWQTLTAWFPSPAVSQFTVVVAQRSTNGDGSGGAVYGPNNPSVLICDAQTAPQVDQTVTAMLALGMAAATLASHEGWQLGSVACEGLWRFLTARLYAGAFEACHYVTADKWLDGARPDIVNSSLPVTPETIGGSVLFLNWWFSLGQPQVTLAAVCGMGDATLRAVYQAVTGDPNDPFRTFNALMRQQYPPGTPCGLATDNPF